MGLGEGLVGFRRAPRGVGGIARVGFLYDKEAFIVTV